MLRGADCVEDDGDVRGEVTTVTGVIQVVDDAAAVGIGADKDGNGKV